MNRWIAQLLIWIVVFTSVCPFKARAQTEPDPPPQAPPQVVVPILMYHHIGGRADRYHVTQEMFECQMDYLGQNGFTAVSIDQIAIALKGGPALSPKPIAITFDDGWRRQFTATLPALTRNNLRATFFIISSHAERYSGFMSFDLLRQIRDAGMWIGSHTVSHAHLPGLSAKRLWYELRASRDVLEAALEQPVTILAYPGGAYNERVMRAAAQAGYVAAVAIGGQAEQHSSHLYALQRIEVNGSWSKEDFIAVVEKPFAQARSPIPSAEPAP
ncbi:MAG: polysaccharide deacetylase family protein [Anaerolineae bacterium]|nr:polysaccharide deacetylase family protein [Thermoflexales bacterium]MDW8408433.1 polysaccharide deacetylase family protein [Anaerolineae bacterium]